MTKHYCRKCGFLLSERNYTCPSCGELTDMDSIVKVNPIGLLFSLLIPPFGVILYLLNNNATPTRGRKYGIAAGIGLFIYICGYQIGRSIITHFISGYVNELIHDFEALFH